MASSLESVSQDAFKQLRLGLHTRTAQVADKLRGEGGGEEGGRELFCKLDCLNGLQLLLTCSWYFIPYLSNS